MGSAGEAAVSPKVPRSSRARPRHHSTCIPRAAATDPRFRTGYGLQLDLGNRLDCRMAGCAPSMRMGREHAPRTQGFQNAQGGG
eukprot:9962858-Alexandrium_andersonii.AAC.1